MAVLEMLAPRTAEEPTARLLARASDLVGIRQGDAWGLLLELEESLVTETPASSHKVGPLLYVRPAEEVHACMCKTLSGSALW